MDYQKKLDIVKELVKFYSITTYKIDDIYNILEDVFNSEILKTKY